MAAGPDQIVDLVTSDSSVYVVYADATLRTLHVDAFLDSTESPDLDLDHDVSSSSNLEASGRFRPGTSLTTLVKAEPWLYAIGPDELVAVDVSDAGWPEEVANLRWGEPIVVVAARGSLHTDSHIGS